MEGPVEAAGAPMEMERYLIGSQRYRHGKVYTFECPTCGKRFTYDEPGEPLCSGPSETTDDHLPEVMLLRQVVTLDKREVTPSHEAAEARAQGALFVPSADDKENKE